MKLIEVIAGDNVTDAVAGIDKKNDALDFRLAQKTEDGRKAIRILVLDEKVQSKLNALQA